MGIWWRWPALMGALIVTPWWAHASAQSQAEAGTPTAPGTPAAAADGADEGAPTAPTGAPSWAMQVSAELGFGTRALELPSDGAIDEVRTGMYPVVGLRLALDYRAASALRLGWHLRYQTSVGLTLTEQLPDATTHARTTRSHQLETALAAAWALDTRAAWEIAVALGYAVAELDPWGHLVTPSYHLGGPYLQLGLQAPLGPPWLHLRLAPEAQWIVQVGQELLERGVHDTGLGVGAAAAIELGLSAHLKLAITYRELHFWLASAQSGTFTDVMRFATAQLTGAL